MLVCLVSVDEQCDRIVKLYQDIEVGRNSVLWSGFWSRAIGLVSVGLNCAEISHLDSLTILINHPPSSLFSPITSSLQSPQRKYLLDYSNTLIATSVNLLTFMFWHMVVTFQYRIYCQRPFPIAYYYPVCLLFL